MAGRLWDCGVCLLQYFAAHPALCTGKRVIELGSGTGVVGLGMARLGAQHVTLTDLAPVCPLLTQNIAMSRLQGCCSAQALCWGEDCSAVAPADVIIAADVVYEPEYFDALASSFTELCRAGGKDCKVLSPFCLPE